MQEGFIGAFGPCSLEGSRDRLARSKVWGVKEGGARRWLGGDHQTGGGKSHGVGGVGVWRNERPREWRVMGKVRFPWAEGRLQW